MKKSDKKSDLAVLFILLGLYLVLVVAIPYATLSLTAGATLTAIYDHFVSMKASLKGDVYFLAIVIGILVALYYFMIYRPKKVSRGKKAKEISLARKIGFGLVVAYGLLLIVLPYITLPVDAAAYLVSIWDHFQGVKDAIISDFSFLALSATALFGGYYFMVYKPKLK